MKIALFVFLGLIALAFANSCTYVSSDSKWFYSLEGLELDSGIPYSASNNDATYYFNFCDDVDDLKDDSSIVCPKDSGSCMKKNNVFVKLGDADSMLWADSAYGSDKGIELTYGSGDVCDTDPAATHKTLFRLNCSSTEVFSVVDVVTQDCFTTISIRSMYACPSATLGGDEQYSHRHHSSGFGGIIGIALLCGLCLCCTCCVRMCRRKCRSGSYCRSACKTQCRKDGYTEVEFQTISTGDVEQQAQPIQQQQQQPMVAPQFFVYPGQQQQMGYGAPMYFVPQGQVPQPIISTPQDQLASDEALARQLQAQLNNE